MKVHAANPDPDRECRRRCRTEHGVHHHRFTAHEETLEEYGRFHYGSDDHYLADVENVSVSIAGMSIQASFQ